MLRDKNLIPLSHQHRHALALCVRIERGVQGGEVDLSAWQAEVQQIFEQEIRIHFAAEETELFPAVQKLGELRVLIEELVREHAVLRDHFARAAERSMDSAELCTFAGKLCAHIRKEERQLFEQMQRLMTAEELRTVGAALDKALQVTAQACALPNQATRLRSRAEIDKF